MLCYNRGELEINASETYASYTDYTINLYNFVMVKLSVSTFVFILIYHNCLVNTCNIYTPMDRD